MTLIKVNIAEPIPEALWRLAAELPPDAPIIAMVHGYRYSPGHRQFDPHDHLLSLTPRPGARALSWPRALGFGAGNTGLAIAVGWPARGSLARAYRGAAEAGEKLAEIADRLRTLTGRPLSVIGHSLGARVALQALPHAKAGSFGRLVLLTGAEFRDDATLAVESPAGRYAEIINITSRENDLFDFALEMLIARGKKHALGHGLADPRSNWIDVQIDCRETLRALAIMGFPMDSSILRLSHWTPYLREGVFDFYRTALCQEWALPMHMLRLRLPGNAAPRWSRLFANDQGQIA